MRSPVAAKPVGLLASLVLVLGGVTAASWPEGGTQAAVPHVAAATAKASMSLGAPIGQSRSGTTDLTPGTARFSPVRKGAKVKIQRKVSGTWKTVVTGAQSGNGTFSFMVKAGPPSDPYTFRARTEPKGASATNSPSTRATDWKLAWADEFSGTKLGSAWKIRSSGGAVAKRICAEVTQRQTVVKDGKARLSVRVNPNRVPNVTDQCPYGQFENAMVGTQSSKAFQYGMFAARLQFPAPRGEHGSFWLQSGGPTPAGAPAPGNAGAEIDITEYFGDGYRDGGLANFVYPAGATDSAGKPLKLGGLIPKSTSILGSGNRPSNGYHVYSVEWTPKAYIFRLDGVETMRLTKGVSHHPEFLVMSLLSSDWEVKNLPKDQLPTTMKVDWVRVWQ
jgi:beta-glucanase (GH16 family)